MNVMGRKDLFNLLLCLLPIVGLTAGAQSPESYHRFLTPQVASGKLSPPQHISDFKKNAALSISLNDAVRLALANNSNIRIQETQIEAQKFVLLGAHQPFDPLLQAIANVNRNSTPGSSELQGIGQTNSAALNSLTQLGQISYSELFKTGTSIAGTISSTKNSTNDSFNFFNPYFDSLLSFQFTQPLLRSAGVFANTAPLIIARRNLQQSRANFDAQVNDAIFESWSLTLAEHPLRETLGEKVFGDLVRYFGKSMILVPLARHWRVEIYASQNMTHAQIARKLGCGETMVYRALKKLRAERDQMVLNF